MSDAFDGRLADYDEHEVSNLAEENRGELPAEFFTFLVDVEASFVREKVPQEFRERGLLSEGPLGNKIGWAVLVELHRLLCMKGDRHYADIRKQGKVLTQKAIGAMAVYTAGAAGIPEAAAASAVAFATLLIGRVGIAVFCRLMSPLINDSPTG